jgi:3-deoxy-7-phosphoheptulonate synthase
VLRGGRSGPNYDNATVDRAVERMRAAGLAPRILVDCSHANAAGDYRKQADAWSEVLAARAAGQQAVVGAMLESNLRAGKQPIPADLSQLQYGVSITDACIDWETTERLISEAAESKRLQATG